MESHPRKESAFWAINIGHMITHWYIASFYILLPYITLELGFSVTQSGLVVTIMFIVKSIIGIPIGALTDMTSNKNILMAISVILSSLPFIIMGYVDSFWALAVLLIIMGGGNEFWHPASFATLSSRYPGKRGFVFGFHGMAANVGDLLAPAFVGVLLLTMTWRETVVWNYLPGLVATAAVLFMLRGINVRTKTSGAPAAAPMSLKDYTKDLKRLIRNRFITLLALSSGFRAMAGNGMRVLLPLYLAIEMDLSPIWVALYYSALQGGGLLAGPFVGSLSDKLGRRKVVMSGLIASSVLVICVTFVQIEWLLVSVIALLGFFLYAMRPVMQAWAMESTAENMAGTTASLMFTTQALMVSMGPAIVGAFADAFSFNASFYFIAFVMVVSNVIIFFIPDRNRAKQA